MTREVRTGVYLASYRHLGYYRHRHQRYITNKYDTVLLLFRTNIFDLCKTKYNLYNLFKPTCHCRVVATKNYLAYYYLQILVKFFLVIFK